jgi:hypothetical protein
MQWLADKPPRRLLQVPCMVKDLCHTAEVAFNVGGFFVLQQRQHRWQQGQQPAAETQRQLDTGSFTAGQLGMLVLQKLLAMCRALPDSRELHSFIHVTPVAWSLGVAATTL